MSSMTSGFDRAFASCCRRRPTGDAAGAARGRPGPSVQATAAARRWEHLVRHLRRVRQLQRLFGYLGQALQSYPGPLRQRLRLVDPTDYQRRHGTGRR
jgi:hypothetical protein